MNPSEQENTEQGDKREFPGAVLWKTLPDCLRRVYHSAKKSVRNIAVPAIVGAGTGACIFFAAPKGEAAPPRPRVAEQEKQNQNVQYNGFDKEFSGYGFKIHQTLPSALQEQFESPDNPESERLRRALQDITSRSSSRKRDWLKNWEGRKAAWAELTKEAESRSIVFYFLDKNKDDKYTAGTDRIIPFYTPTLRFRQGDKVYESRHLFDASLFLEANKAWLDYRVFVYPPEGKRMGKQFLKSMNERENGTPVDFSSEATRREIVGERVTTLAKLLSQYNEQGYLTKLAVEEFVSYFGSLEKPNIRKELDFDIYQACDGRTWLLYIFEDRNGNRKGDTDEPHLNVRMAPGPRVDAFTRLNGPPARYLAFSDEHCSSSLASIDEQLQQKPRTEPSVRDSRDTQASSPSSPSRVNFTGSAEAAASVISRTNREVSGSVRAGATLAERVSLVLAGRGAYHQNPRRMNDFSVQMPSASSEPESNEAFFLFQSYPDTATLLEYGGRAELGVHLEPFAIPLSMYGIAGIDALRLAATSGGNDGRVIFTLLTPAYGGGMETRLPVGNGLTLHIEVLKLISNDLVIPINYGHTSEFNRRLPGVGGYSTLLEAAYPLTDSLTARLILQSYGNTPELARVTPAQGPYGRSSGQLELEWLANDHFAFFAGVGKDYERLNPFYASSGLRMSGGIRLTGGKETKNR